MLQYKYQGVSVMKKKIMLIILVVIIVLELLVFYNCVSVASLNSLEIKDNMKEDNNMLMEITLNPAKFVVDDEIWCYISQDKEPKSLEWIKAEDNKCSMIVNDNEYIIYLKNKFGYVKEVASKDVELSKIMNLSFDKTEYFVPNGGDELFKLDFEKYGIVNSEIKYTISDESILKIENNRFIGLNDGKTTVTATVGNRRVETTVYVMSSIVDPVINSKKEYIACKQYTEEEALLLDKALEDRINTAGYATRAGAVAAARFLALEFADKIPYFYENGRLENYGEIRYVDGEGRYYHKGLYLSENKYEGLVATYKGPAMWGCKLMNYTSEGGYRAGVKYANGLDCSGFISWSLYNGGFDVGDVGAGDSPYVSNELYDLGNKKTLTMELIKSGEIKVGDLIAYWGHMAMIVGIDDENLYIAESLPETKGVVVKQYSYAKAIKVFVDVLLMDEVYKQDGNLTIMWN